MTGTEQTLRAHVQELLACQRCPKMHRPSVSGGPVVSKVFLVGQAPGVKEPELGKPFAWTAGKTLFKWFEQSCGLTEEQFRNTVYMAAVCRCFPGKNPAGGDRVPEPDEISACDFWLSRELQILQPDLVLAVGKLAIAQFISFEGLSQVVGKVFRVRSAGHDFDLIPLPHPSGASTWHRMEPGKTLLGKALQLAASHSAMQTLRSIPNRTS